MGGSGKVKEDVVSSGGKEYVSVVEFANRVEVTRQTIYGYINKGILKVSDPHKDGSKLLDWEKESVKFKTAWRKNMKRNPNKKQIRVKDAAKKKKVPFDAVMIQKKANGEVKLAELNASTESTIPSTDVPDNPSDLVMKINPWDHPDCWLLVAEGATNPILDPKGLPMLDWDRMKTKMMAESYAFQLDVKRGQYISKEDCIASLSALVQMVLSTLAVIPSRYGSTFVAFAERDMGKEMTAEGRQSVNTILAGASKKIVDDIRREAEKILEAMDERKD